GESKESRESKESGDSWESIESGESKESRKSRESAKESIVAGVCASCATVNDDDEKFCKSCGSKLLALLLAVLIPFSFFVFPFVAPASAQLQMPDPKQMSGIPRPVTDLPAGHVSVRLIRGQLSNNIQGHPVEIVGGTKPM